jgi:hypothetical protein
MRLQREKLRSRSGHARKKVELINRLNPRWMDIGDEVLGE